MYCSRLLLFLIFFPRDESLVEETRANPGGWRTALTVAFLCLLHGLITIIVSAALIYSHPHYLATWANILGIGATVLAAIQYFPQIWTTYHLRHVGSLSIPMMVIQTPGSFVWAGSLAARLGPEGWSTWGIFLVTGCLQGCLLFMGIYFEIEARKQQEEAEDVNVRSYLLNLHRSILANIHRDPLEERRTRLSVSPTGA
jgi:hypothetical protein